MKRPKQKNMDRNKGSVNYVITELIVNKTVQIYSSETSGSSYSEKASTLWQQTWGISGCPSWGWFDVPAFTYMPNKTWQHQYSSICPSLLGFLSRYLPLTVAVQHTASLVATDRWRCDYYPCKLHSFSSLSSFAFSIALSVPPSLLGFISSPGQCSTVRSWCDLCHGLWSWLISLHSVVLFPCPSPSTPTSSAAPQKLVSLRLSQPGSSSSSVGEELWGHEGVKLVQ